ncbi:hypothetical protein KBC79_05220, partial [Candidatus Woesebacteria bacterium]|nr:hypothetical protein [Candidatus Woesebacteria bacterium]
MPENPEGKDRGWSSLFRRGQREGSIIPLKDRLTKATRLWHAAVERQVRNAIALSGQPMYIQSATETQPEIRTPIQESASQQELVSADLFVSSQDKEAFGLTREKVAELDENKVARLRLVFGTGDQENRLFEEMIQRVKNYADMFFQGDVSALLRLAQAHQRRDINAEVAQLRAFLGRFDRLTWQGLCWFLYTKKQQLVSEQTLDAVYPAWRTAPRSVADHIQAERQFVQVQSPLELRSITLAYERLVLRPERFKRRDLEALLDWAQPLFESIREKMIRASARNPVGQPLNLPQIFQGLRLNDQEKQTLAFLRELDAIYLSRVITGLGQRPIQAAEATSVQRVLELSSYTGDFATDTQLALRIKYTTLKEAGTPDELKHLIRRLGSLKSSLPEDSIVADPELDTTALQVVEELAAVFRHMRGDDFVMTTLLPYVSKLSELSKVLEQSEQLTSFSEALVVLREYWEVLERLVAQNELQLLIKPGQKPEQRHFNLMREAAVAIVKHYTAKELRIVPKLLVTQAMATRSVVGDLQLESSMALSAEKNEVERYLLGMSVIVLGKMRKYGTAIEARSYILGLDKVLNRRLRDARRNNKARLLLNPRPTNKRWYSYYESVPTLTDTFRIDREGGQTEMVETSDILQLLSAARQALG